ncbi:MAG: hypothetical protein WCK17_09670, partial [Verrucomicrobiota bacterium]
AKSPGPCAGSSSTSTGGWAESVRPEWHLECLSRAPIFPTTGHFYVNTMSSFIHAADLHIDSPMCSLP